MSGGGRGEASIKPHTFQNGELKIEVGTTKAHNALGAPANLELTGSVSGFISEDRVGSEGRVRMLGSRSSVGTDHGLQGS